MKMVTESRALTAVQGVTYVVYEMAYLHMENTTFLDIHGTLLHGTRVSVEVIARVGMLGRRRDGDHALCQ